MNIWLALTTAVLWLAVAVWWIRIEWRAAFMRLIDRLRGW
jgi:hypothetical protein